ALVLPHRHLLGAVGEHICGLQDRIDKQAGRDELALGGGLVAKLMHPLQAPELGDAGEQPGQLGVLRHVALAKEGAARRVEAGREQDGRRVVEPLAQLGRLVGHGDGVQVHDAEDALDALLAGYVLGDRADVVAEVLAARRLDAGEDAHGSQLAGTGGRRRREGSVSHGGSQPRALGVTFTPGGAISSIRSSTSALNVLSAAGSWLSSCSIVRGPMIAAVTAGWLMTNASAISIREIPTSSASSPSAWAASSLRWLAGRDMS